jgi:hypothetical protein
MEEPKLLDQVREVIRTRYYGMPSGSQRGRLLPNVGRLCAERACSHPRFMTLAQRERRMLEARLTANESGGGAVNVERSDRRISSAVDPVQRARITLVVERRWKFQLPEFATCV